jgi:hypothetical protein
MGTRHLYWILTGPSFAVWSFMTNSIFSGSQLRSYIIYLTGCETRLPQPMAYPVLALRGIQKTSPHHVAARPSRLSDHL